MSVCRCKPSKTSTEQYLYQLTHPAIEEESRLLPGSEKRDGTERAVAEAGDKWLLELTLDSDGCPVFDPEGRNFFKEIGRSWPNSVRSASRTEAKLT